MFLFAEGQKTFMAKYNNPIREVIFDKRSTQIFDITRVVEKTETEKNTAKAIIAKALAILINALSCFPSEQGVDFFTVMTELAKNRVATNEKILRKAGNISFV